MAARKNIDPLREPIRWFQIPNSSDDPLQDVLIRIQIREKLNSLFDHWRVPRYLSPLAHIPKTSEQMPDNFLPLILRMAKDKKNPLRGFRIIQGCNWTGRRRESARLGEMIEIAMAVRQAQQNRRSEASVIRELIGRKNSKLHRKEFSSLQARWKEFKAYKWPDGKNNSQLLGIPVRGKCRIVSEGK